MAQRYITLIVLYFCFTIVVSLRCYTGTDRQCLLSPSTTDCGNGEICQCVKYQFRCTADDTACSENERKGNAIKWAYAIVGNKTCGMMKMASNVYMNIECCSQNKCNRPATGRCSYTQERRRTMRHLAGIIATD